MKKAIFIAFDQAYYEDIVNMLQMSNCRGFTGWTEVQGRGTTNGEPHYASHAWPSVASAIMTVVDESKVDSVLNQLHEMDLAKPKLGLRAFVFPVERTI